MTLEQFILDTLEVTNYLRGRFGKDKIDRMGLFRRDFHRHSGGRKSPGVVPRVHRNGADVVST